RGPVVRPERRRLQAERVAETGRERERPGSVHAGAERREDADPPVADLVPEALDDDGPVGGDGAGGRRLLVQELEQVPRRPFVERVLRRQSLDRLLRAQRDELARGLADLGAELERPPHSLALPEGNGAGNAGRGRDEYPVAGDLLDPPGRCPEQERLACARLVHHLLVELADATAAVDEVDAEEPAIGDRAGVGDRKPARSLAAADDTAGAIPDDPGPQL